MSSFAPSFAVKLAFLILARRLVCAAVVGVLAGSAAAFFLDALDRVTEVRFERPWLVWLLPVAGVVTVWVYRRVGGRSAQGNNLILEEIHEPGGGVPLRMAPLVLAGTLLTHLCGGSAGREGTAVQMGGALAGGLHRRFKLPREDQGLLLCAGVAGGFGGVFGTPIAGAIFALEVLARGRIHYGWLAPCLVAALVGDLVCHAWGSAHVDFQTIAALGGEEVGGGELANLARVATLGLVCGLVARAFVGAVHGVSRVSAKATERWWLPPLLGGCGVVGLAALLGTDAYLGLGVVHPDPAAPTLITLFNPGVAGPFDWTWKLVFTAITVGVGFKGGEVTPLFFIGAALGAVVGPWLGLPIGLSVALGFTAVFSGATKTPVACTLLGLELFGGDQVTFFALACLMAYFFGGSGGLYSAQRQG